MQKYTITVTQEDIDTGERDDCNRCPIALAAGRVLGGKVIVDDDWIISRADFNDSDFYALTDEARQFILRFDAGEPVSPFTFEVEPDAL
jgi:hypothetical protein